MNEKELKDSWCVDSISSVRYYTQGYGSEKYAKNHAEGIADKFRYANVLVEVTRSEWCYNNKSRGNLYNINRHVTFEVMVNCDKDLANLIIKKELPLRDVLKASLKRGCNIWVEYPMLPPDILEKLNLDSFGKDLLNRNL